MMIQVVNPNHGALSGHGCLMVSLPRFYRGLSPCAPLGHGCGVLPLPRRCRGLSHDAPVGQKDNHPALRHAKSIIRKIIFAFPLSIPTGGEIINRIIRPIPTGCNVKGHGETVVPVTPQCLAPTGQHVIGPPSRQNLTKISKTSMNQNHKSQMNVEGGGYGE